MELFTENKIPRELARYSQTDVTADHSLGYQYAIAAHEAGLNPEVRESDPTLAGEAAAKAGLRGEQAGKKPEIVDAWFRASHKLLAGESETMGRERVVTYLLEGRALALRQLGGAAAEGTSERASKSFRSGEVLLVEQHWRGEKWDRYGTMLSRHRGTHEAMSGDAVMAASIAFGGIWRSIRSDYEKANVSSSLVGHILFVGKQAIFNFANLPLAATRKAENISVVQKTRLRVARRMLG